VSVELVQIDAFTDTPFCGNPAAVCFLSEKLDPGWMQHVAAEMRLSETAFVHCRADGAFDLRWFTPIAEVDLCGHATLASAHALWESRRLEPNREARFHTRSGVLTAWKREEWIEMDFPAQPVVSVEPPFELAEALGVRPIYVGKNRTDYLVELGSEREVREATPNFQRLGALSMRGVMVTAVASGRYDFVSRFFAPRVGVSEDPVTGSAHCCLGPFWRGRLGRDTLTGFQASARGGIVRVRVDGGRVRLSGQAVTVMRADLLC
jgi:PhzF family phenazine biosynthesis protein